MKPRMTLPEPRFDGGVEFVDVPGEKVVRVFHDYQPIVARQRANNLLDFDPLAKLIVCAVHK